MPDRVRTRDSLTSTIVIAIAIVVVGLFATAIAVGAELGHSGLNSASTPIVTTVLGLLAAAIPSLVALVKADKAERKTDVVNEKVNGHLAQQTAIVTELAAHVSPELVQTIINGVGEEPKP